MATSFSCTSATHSVLTSLQRETTLHPPVLNDQATPFRLTGSPFQSSAVSVQSASSLLFIDSTVDDYQSLIAGATPGTEVHWLSSSQDAVTQITNTLLGRRNISSLHIVSHGEAGGLDFGSGVLNLADLPSYAAQIQSWSKALTDDADLLLYGCDVAQGELGQTFVNILSRLTSADVAASSDLTGSASKGGNWNLEYETGRIETGLVFNQTVRDSYQSILPLAFSAATSFAVGSGPIGLTLGDLNGDAKPDIVTGDNGATTVSVLLGTGTGSFSAATPYTVGVGPTGSAIGDFNGDGKSDLAIANYGSSNISVLLGTGTGSFGAATNFTAGTRPYSIAVGDFNGDGKADLAAANYASGNISILLGTGTGTFGAATNFAVGGFPQSIAIGDFDGDGKADLAAANDTNVVVLLGTGTGTFGAATNFTVGSRPQSVAIGDLNGDGKADIAAANYGSGNISVLLGTGTGNFGAATNFTVGTSPGSVAIGDFNGDGVVDLAAANSNSNSVSVLLGTGTGTFGTATSFAVGTRPQSVAIGDFNGDGKVDIAATNQLSNDVSVLLNISDIDPTVGLSPATLGYTENDPATLIDTTATVSDPDSANFDTGTLTVSFSANGSVDDRLAINNQGNGIGQIGVSGSTVTYSGTAIGTFTGGVGTTPFVVTFNSSSSPAAAQALLRNLTYSNISNAPSTSDRQLSVVLTDGDGGTSTTVNKTITVTAVNDAPIVGVGSGLIYRTSIDGNSAFQAYNPLTNTWSTLGTVNTKAQLAAAPDGSIYMLNASTNKIQKYNVTANTWSDVISGPTAPIAFGDLEVTNAGEFVLTQNPWINGAAAAVMWYTVGGVWRSLNLPGSASVLADYEPSTGTLVVGKDGSLDAWKIDLATLGITSFTSGTSSSEARRFGEIYNGSWYSRSSNGQITRFNLSNNSLPLQTVGGTPTSGNWSSSALNEATGIFYFNGYGSTAFEQWNAATNTFTSLASAPTGAGHNTLAYGSGRIAFTALDEDPTTNSGDLLSTLLSSKVTDADASDPKGIAVTAVNNTNGTWQFSLDGSTWADFGNPANNAARLLSLDATTRIRFVPKPDFNGEVANGITFRAWDQTDGMPNGATADTSTNGGTTSFSAKTVSASITINPVNDAPTVAAPNAIAVIEDTTTPLAGISFADVDAGSGTLTAVLSVGAGTLAGTAGNGVTIVGNASSSITLNGTLTALNNLMASSLTYTPALNDVAPRTLSVRINDGGNTGSGGPLASAVTTIGLAITAVNDAPAFTKGTDQTVTAGAGAQTITNWATGFNPGPADEASQTVQAYEIVNNDHPELFAVAPAIDRFGNLTYTPVNSVAVPTTATVSVRVRDSGGTANGGVDTSAVQTFAITVKPQPTVSITPVSQNEGDSGTTIETFTASLSDTSTQEVRVDYATADGTATVADGDYAATAGTLIFAPGDTSKTFTVSVTGDTKYENTEDFLVNLSNAVNSTIANGSNSINGTIVNDDSVPAVSISPAVTHAEGNSGTTSYTFTVSLSNASAQTVSVNYVTADGTATAADGDYVAASSLLSFAPGEISKTLTVLVNGDTKFEADQTFNVVLSNASNSTLGSSTGTATIVNDDTRPIISINNVSNPEGKRNTTTNYTFAVSLSNASDETVTVNYSTADGTATVANSDYSSTAGTLTFAAGATTQSITVVGNGDNHIEPNETFVVNLATPSNGTIAPNGGTGTGTIVNDDRNKDFNGDGNNDLLWHNNTTGQTVVWELNGTTFSTAIALPTITDINWRIQGTSDFDGDGDPDILWRNEKTGENLIWQLNGATYGTYVTLPTVSDLSWSVAGIADFDNDYSPDILWRNRATGENIIWKLNGTSYSTFSSLPTISTTTWQIKATTDFDNDGAAEILWRNASTGENIIWKLNGLAYSTYIRLPSIVDRNWTITGTGNFGDKSTPDIVWRNNATGEALIWQLNGTTYSTFSRLPTIDSPYWSIQNIADFNADSSSDLFWRNYLTGEDNIWKLDGRTYSTYTSLPTINDQNWVIF